VLKSPNPGLSLVTFAVQRQWLVYLNKKKAQEWDIMTEEEKAEYQADLAGREKDGNKRLDSRFAYWSGGLVFLAGFGWPCSFEGLFGNTIVVSC
jgi:hypothetical protein